MRATNSLIWRPAGAAGFSGTASLPHWASTDTSWLGCVSRQGVSVRVGAGVALVRQDRQRQHHGHKRPGLECALKCFAIGSAPTQQALL